MSWWAVFTEPRSELRARDNLREAGVDVFAPFERVKRRLPVRGSRGVMRLQTVDEVVFPRYIFACADEVGEVCGARGVIDVVRSVGRPLEVPMSALRPFFLDADADGMIGQRDTGRRSYSFHARVGDRFSFGLSSPLAGFIGKVDSLAALDTTGQIRVFVDLLGASRLVDVSYKDVGPVLKEAAA